MWGVPVASFLFFCLFRAIFSVCEDRSLAALREKKSSFGDFCWHKLSFSGPFLVILICFDMFGDFLTKSRPG